MNTTYICPRCHSSEIQSVPIACAQGTTRRLGFIPNTTTDFANLLSAPPRPVIKPIKYWCVGAIIFLFGLVFSLFLMFLVRDPWPFFLGIIASIYLSVKYAIGKRAELKLQQQEYEAQMAEWQSSFVCLRCGNIFKLQ